MMENNKSNCWYRLNVNIEDALSKDWKFPSTKETWNGIGLWPFDKESIFNNRWINYMNEVALPIAGLILFYREPNLIDTEAHVDLFGEKSEQVRLAFNWVLGGADSEMIWYELPEGYHSPQSTPDGNKYLSWKINELREIDRCSIRNELTLIRVDRPHSIIVGNEERWAFSARTSLKDLTWDEAVAHLKEKKVIIDR